MINFLSKLLQPELTPHEHDEYENFLETDSCNIMHD